MMTRPAWIHMIVTACRRPGAHCFFVMPPESRSDGPMQYDVDDEPRSPDLSYPLRCALRPIRRGVVVAGIRLFKGQAPVAYRIRVPPTERTRVFRGHVTDGLVARHCVAQGQRVESGEKAGGRRQEAGTARMNLELRRREKPPLFVVAAFRRR